ncbi:MAG: Gfo/Idh/MocA family protein [Gemmatimonadota bacterium]
MNRIRICILGCGSIARTHSRVLRSVRSGVSLLFASRSPEKAEAYRRRFRGARAFGSYEEACASHEVDAVVICTPHSFHLEHARLAAAHGKHMLIEKPAAISLEELSEMERLVDRTGVTCMVAENYHFKPLVRALRRHLEAGDVGEPLYIELNRTGLAHPGGWRTDAEMMGGGALVDGGVHWVNLMLALGGRARQVLAARPETSSARRAPLEDGLEVLIKFESGAVGKLLHAWNARNRIGGLSTSRIYGTLGNIIFESNGLWALVLGRRRRLRVPGLRDLMGYRGMMKEFLACLREGRESTMPLTRARRDLEVVFAAYRSLSSGRFEPTAP